MESIEKESSCTAKHFCLRVNSRNSRQHYLPIILCHFPLLSYLNFDNFILDD